MRFITCDRYAKITHDNPKLNVKPKTGGGGPAVGLARLLVGSQEAGRVKDVSIACLRQGTSSFEPGHRCWPSLPARELVGGS